MKYTSGIEETDLLIPILHDVSEKTCLVIPPPSERTATQIFKGK
jgi:hypothetical protein